MAPAGIPPELELELVDELLDELLEEELEEELLEDDVVDEALLVEEPLDELDDEPFDVSGVVPPHAVSEAASATPVIKFCQFKGSTLLNNLLIKCRFIALISIVKSIFNHAR